MIGRGSALDERRGPHDDSQEILVKTPGNNSSLRLNAKSSQQQYRIVWEVTLPLEAPLHLVKENDQWVSFGKGHAPNALIEAIGQAIDEQLAL
jgi:hypothetical protein